MFSSFGFQPYTYYYYKCRLAGKLSVAGDPNTRTANY